MQRALHYNYSKYITLMKNCVKFFCNDWNLARLIIACINNVEFITIIICKLID